MTIEMNEDIEKYEETVVMGMTARQTIFSGLSVAVGAGIILFLYFKVGLGIMLSCYIAVPFVMPIALMGFYSYNGMNFFQFFSRFIRSFHMSEPLVYRSTESMKEYRKLMERLKEKRKRQKKKRRGGLRPVDNGKRSRAGKRIRKRKRISGRTRCRRER